MLWQAVALRLEGSRSEHWVQLLYLAAAHAAQLSLASLRASLPRGRWSAARQLDWLLAAAELLLDCCLLSATVWPLIFVIPAASRSLLISGLALRPPLQPAWAAVLLLPPTLLAAHARTPQPVRLERNDAALPQTISRQL